LLSSARARRPGFGVRPHATRSVKTLVTILPSSHGKRFRCDRRGPVAPIVGRRHIAGDSRDRGGFRSVRTPPNGVEHFHADRSTTVATRAQKSQPAPKRQGPGGVRVGLVVGWMVFVFWFWPSQKREEKKHYVRSSSPWAFVFSRKRKRALNEFFWYEEPAAFGQGRAGAQSSRSEPARHFRPASGATVGGVCTIKRVDFHGPGHPARGETPLPELSASHPGLRLWPSSRAAQQPGFVHFKCQVAVPQAIAFSRSEGPVSNQKLLADRSATSPVYAGTGWTR